MSNLSFNDRVKGCLYGAVAGAEFGYAAISNPDRFVPASPADMLNIELQKYEDADKNIGNVNVAKVTPFLNLGFKAYIDKGGRVTPEDFAPLLMEDEGVATPAFQWDPVHTTQEVLREGMHPRISGMGNVPCGFICASMPAVGIFHAASPDYAYLDGVELASVTQPRTGADWAGLCAAAVAKAFDGSASGADITKMVLGIAFEHNRELFYQLNAQFKWWGASNVDETAFLDWWFYGGFKLDPPQGATYWGFNPLYCLLPLLNRYADDPVKIMKLLAATPHHDPVLSCTIAGAILGTMHGAEALPVDWVNIAKPVADPWLPIADVTRKRLNNETEIIKVVEDLCEKQRNGDSLLRDNVYGCILAGAIGNAMGSPMEGRMWQQVDAEYPNGVLTVLDPRRLESEDDNQMAMMMVETYIAREGKPIAARHFGKTWMERMNRDMFFINCMGHVYDLIKTGWDARITGHWTQVTGSTVMCMEPVGMFYTADPEYAAIDARNISYMYQRGLDNVMACVLAACVADAFRPEATVDSILQAALNAAPRTKLAVFDKRKFDNCYEYFSTCLDVADKYDDVFAVRAELYEKCLQYHCIDPMELFGFALAMFKVAKGDVRLSAIGGTNIGRDADTIAGRAAMLAGALNGGGGVPQDWIDMFKPEILAKIQANSRRFADFISGPKLAQMKLRQSGLGL
jgi:ADP-ribosylglycohydrolase